MPTNKFTATQRKLFSAAHPEPWNVQSPLDWKTVSSDYLFQDTWLTARKDVCERPDGKLISPYYVMEYPNWVCALAQTKENKFVLVKQYRQALGSSLIELAGGCIDPEDSSPEEAARRELLEETGFSFDHFEYLGHTSANPSTNNNLMYMFLATGGVQVKKQNLDPNEEIEVLQVTLNEMVELINGNMILQSMHTTCILHGFKKLGLLHYL